MSEKSDEERAMLLDMLTLPVQEVIIINYLMAQDTASHAQLKEAAQGWRQDNPDWQDADLDALLETLDQNGFIEAVLDENGVKVYQVTLGHTHQTTQHSRSSIWDDIDFSDL